MSDISTSYVEVVEGGPVDQNQIVGKISLYDADGNGVTPGVKNVTTDSAIGTVGKSTTSDEPPANSLVAVTFTNGNSAASPTLAFNGGTARAMKLGGTASAAAKLAVAAGGVALFLFDGTTLHQIGAYT